MLSIDSLHHEKGCNEELVCKRSCRAWRLRNDAQENRGFGCHCSGAFRGAFEQRQVNVQAAWPVCYMNQSDVIPVQASLEYK